ncbi:hypothetical protein V9T40_003290 [Parthenolecanium corni]|uniref:Uncharacterized protein n=1 Tax=Parthenolecanium corni TaxID=536013 RepID=A0AAN9Y8Q9_9HEMI
MHSRSADCIFKLMNKHIAIPDHFLQTMFTYQAVDVVINPQHIVFPLASKILSNIEKNIGPGGSVEPFRINSSKARDVSIENESLNVIC